MKTPRYKVGDVVMGRTCSVAPILPLRIDRVIDQRGWVKDPIDDPTPSYIVTDVSNLFGISGYFIGEEDIIEKQRNERQD